MRIFFRADGNSKIGYGHVIRSLALSEILASEFEVDLLIQKPSDQLVALIQSSAAAVTQLPTSSNLLDEIELIVDLLDNDSILVLDGYHFEEKYQKKLKEKGIPLVSVDDLCQHHFYSDLIINHSPGITETHYSAEDYSQFCLGPKYALLRSPFIREAQSARSMESLESVFVSFGGSDLYNITDKCLSQLVMGNAFSRIQVLIGGDYAHKSKLMSQYGSGSYDLEIIFHVNLNAEKVVDIMRSCQVAICSASTVAYEVCCVQMPLYIGFYAENQRNFYQELLKQKVAIGLGNLLENPRFDRIQYGNNDRELIDAQGVLLDGKQQSRFLNAFRSLSQK